MRSWERKKETILRASETTLFKSYEEGGGDLNLDSRELSKGKIFSEIPEKR